MQRGEKPVILLVEDDPDDQLIFQECLHACRADVELKIVNDGVELSDYLNRTGNYERAETAPYPDIIFLDLNMPRKNGIDSLKEIRDGGFKGIVVVIWTTTDKTEAADECLRMGADLFMTKPVNIEETVQNIQMVLERYAAGSGGGVL